MLICIITIGFLFGMAATAGINWIPAHWLCDYGEKPKLCHMAPRIRFVPWGFFWSGFSAFTAGRLWYLMPSDLFPGAVPQIFLLLAALCILLQIAAVDRIFSIIPDEHILLLLLLSMILSVADLYGLSSGRFMPLFHYSFLSPLLGALLCGGFPLLAGFISHKLTKRETLGFGDVKLLAALGLMMGPVRGLTVLALSFLLSGCVFSILLLAKRVKPKEEKPFGPYIAACFAAYLLFYPHFEELLLL